MIVAMCKNGGIGIKNTIPWYFKKDLNYFKKLTIGDGNNAIIMGKNTWNSINNTPLPKRDNLILSTSLNIPNAFDSKKSLQTFIERMNYNDVWVIGGSSIYDLFLKNIDELYITYIDKHYECDTFFPSIDTHLPHVTSYYSTKIIENDIDLYFQKYIINHKKDCQ